MKPLRWIAFALLISFVPSLAAQRRDPLTDKEVDQLRETAQEPDKRMHLWVTFAKARIEAIDHLRSDKKMADTQAEKVSELLDDVASIVDEIDQNLSEYDKQGSDLRKSLREVIEMDSDFQLKLRAIKDTTEKGPRKLMNFTLDNAMESVNASADSARAMLDDENTKLGKEKPEKPEKKNAKADKDKKDKPESKDKKDRPDYTGIGGAGQEKPQ